MSIENKEKRTASSANAGGGQEQNPAAAFDEATTLSSDGVIPQALPAKTPSVETKDSEGPSSMASKRLYRLADAVMSLFMMAMGYFFIQCFVLNEIGLGASVFSLLFFGSALLYAHVCRIRVKASGYILLGIIPLFGLIFFFSGNMWIKGMNLLFLLLYSGYAVMALFGRRAENRMGDFSGADWLKAVIVMPFSRFGVCFASLSALGKEKRGRRVLLALIGILIALIPTAAAGSLLIRADAVFAGMVQGIDFSLSDLGWNFKLFCFGLPAAMYLAGMFYASASDANPNLLNAERSRAYASRMRFLPAVVTCTAMLPLCLLYILFFISQTAYFLSAFAGMLPEGIGTADYARQGFFELCRVAVINGVMIALVSVFTKRNAHGKKPQALKLMITVLSGFTLALIAVAMSKMLLYIGQYGLTQKRVYTIWFMCLLAVFFLFVVIRQFVPRFNLTLASFVLFCVMWGTLAFSDSDGLIAKYNVDRYQKGDAETVDIESMTALGDAAVPYVLPLCGPGSEPGDPIGRAAQSWIDCQREIHNQQQELSWISLNLPRLRAAAMLKTVS